jgi:hypothetical protein
MSGDEFYDDDVTSGVAPSYPISGPGLEPSGVTPVRAADGPGATSSDGGSPETERATSNVDSPDRTYLLRDHGFAADRPDGPRTRDGHALASRMRRADPAVDWDAWVREIEDQAVVLWEERRVRADNLPRSPLPHLTEQAASDGHRIDGSGDMLHDVETCPLCLPGLARLAEAIERLRVHHDKTLGHSPTNRIGYCAEPDGISATYCETGILLAGLR